MDSFEINKIIAAVLLIVLIVIGIGKISDIAFHVDKPQKSAYKVEIQVNNSETISKVERADISINYSLFIHDERGGVMPPFFYSIGTL